LCHLYVRDCPRNRCREQDADSSNGELGYVAVKSTPLPFGLMPSQCAGSKIQIGDVGLELADVRYHPKVLKATEVGAAELTLTSEQPICAT
jgi:hypothetical protein